MPSVEVHDLIILGGGISGLGVAREAARRGLKTVLLEARTCCGGTSNNTLRIIHGGFRYLQNGDLPRVCKSLLDQKAILKEAPDAVAPLPCVMPLARFGLKSRFPVSCANLLYGALMRLSGSPLKAPHILSSAAVDSSIPLLRGLAPHGALCWYDAMMLEPEKVTETLLRQIASGPVSILENTAAVRVELHGEVYEVHDSTGGVRRARAVVNTLGPWLSSVQLPHELVGTRPRWCKGFNITISRQLDPKHGIGAESRDGRLLFCVPRGVGTAIGTWYTALPNNSTEATASGDEIEKLIQAFNAALPGANVRSSEVIGVDVGVLPMLADSPRGPQLIAHERLHSQRGYIEVLSTKYTTFRSQARRVVRLLPAQ